GLERIVRGALLHQVHGLVADAFGHGLLALAHHVVDELGEQAVLELGVGQDPALGDFSTAGHVRLRRLFLGVRPRTSGLGKNASAEARGRRPEAWVSAGPLCSVLGPALLAAGDAHAVEGAADDVVAHAGEVLDATAADHHHRVLLQVVADAGDVAGHFHPVGE